MKNQKENLEIDEPFISAIKSLRRTYEGAIYLFDEIDTTTSIYILKRIIDKLAALFESIKKQDAETQHEDKVVKFAAHYIKDLGKDSAFIDETIRQLEHADFEINVFAIEEIIARIGIQISLLERHSKLNRLINGKWRALIKNKKFFGALLGALVILGGYFTWDYSYLRKHSLVGHYYSDGELKNLFRVHLDKKIDFNWGYQSPFASFKKDDFSVLWTGYLTIPVSGRYEFITKSDDGVRLWVNDQPIINDWRCHFLTTNSGVINLTKGNVPIRIEYFERNLTAAMTLLWKPEGKLNPEIIPQKYFISDSNL